MLCFGCSVQAWVAFSNRFRDICKAESLIFEYRKYREQFLEWVKISEEKCEKNNPNHPDSAVSGGGTGV